MLRVALLLVIGLTSYVHSADYTCESPSNCKVLPDGKGEIIECAGDCGCGDKIADQCSRPHPTTAVHVNSIEDCMANCQVFALEDRCKFIIYHYDNIDENCIIMNEELDKYAGHCNILGQALWSPTPNTGLSVWGGCKESPDNGCINGMGNCDTCTDCNADKCAGFMLSGCLFFSEPLETSSFEDFANCEKFARVKDAATAVLFKREETSCEYYGGVYDENDWNPAGNMRHCTTAFATLETDLAACGPK